MANHELKNDELPYDRWLNDCLASLNSGAELGSEEFKALARLKLRHRQWRIAIRRWTWTTAGLAAVGIALFLVPASRACAREPGACLQRVWRTDSTNGSQNRAVSANTVVPPAISSPPAAIALTSGKLLSQLQPPSAPVEKAKDRVLSTRSAENFKEIGSPAAPITLEVYTDYECPHCAVFFRDIVPQIMEQYVRTGKVKFLHRDFPLPQHPYAQLAARFANAAGEIGQYELVVNQIFVTQDSWSKTGDIDAEIAKVLPPGSMQKVREIVKSDPHLDGTVTNDVAMGMNLDHVIGTPAVIVVSGERREAVSSAANLPFSVWKSYLDVKLSELAGR